MAERDLVTVIDGDGAVRNFSRSRLEGIGLRVQVYSSAVDFFRITPSGEGGCIVTDIRAADGGGLELLRRLKTLGSSSPVIMLADHGDVALAVQAMKLGAVECLGDPFDGPALISAVVTALAAERAREPPLSLWAERLRTLTPRERSVLESVVGGKSNRTIAAELGVSLSAVEIDRAKLMVKMQVDSMTALVRIWLRSAGP